MHCLGSHWPTDRWPEFEKCLSCLWLFFSHTDFMCAKGLSVSVLGSLGVGFARQFVQRPVLSSACWPQLPAAVQQGVGEAC